MSKEVAIIVSAIFCVFSAIPLSRLEFGIIHWPQGTIISFVLLLIVLCFAAYDIKKLIDNKEYRLTKKFVLLLFTSIIVSSLILMAIVPYIRPPFAV